MTDDLREVLADPAVKGIVAKAIRASLLKHWGIGMKLSGSRQIAEDVIAALAAPALIRDTKGEGL